MCNVVNRCLRDISGVKAVLRAIMSTKQFYRTKEKGNKIHFRRSIIRKRVTEKISSIRKQNKKLNI